MNVTEHGRKMQADIAKGLEEVASALTHLRTDIAKLRKPGGSSKLEMPAPGGDPKRQLTPRAEGGSGPVVVLMAMSVRRVFNLDTVKQTFGVQVRMQMMWKAPPFEELPEPGDSDWEPNWVPKYRFRRLMADNGVDRIFSVKKEGDSIWVVAEVDHLLEIYEQLELASFPVDVQDLCIEIVGTLSTEHVIWGPWPDADRPVVSLQKELVALNDFELVKEIPITHRLGQVVRETVVNTVICHVKVRRKANYYVFNVAAVMCAIVSFTLCAWASHPGDIDSRHGVDFTLILTAVAFKLVLAGMLPPVSYVTLLDVYVMGGFIFLTAVTLSHTMLPWNFIKMVDVSPLTLPPLSNEQELELIKADQLSFWIFLGVWVFFNIVYFSYMRFHGNAIYRAFVAEAQSSQEKNSKEIQDAREKFSISDAPRMRSASTSHLQKAS